MSLHNRFHRHPSNRRLAVFVAIVLALGIVCLTPRPARHQSLYHHTFRLFL